MKALALVYPGMTLLDLTSDSRHNASHEFIHHSSRSRR